MRATARNVFACEQGEALQRQFMRAYMQEVGQLDWRQNAI
jgi:hypothetical protein